MPLQLTTPPSVEPLTLDEAKAHLKVDTTADDALITAMIAAARARAEWHTGRALIAQGWTLNLDAWPASGIVEIPLPPLQSVTSVTLAARDGSTSTLSSSLYTVDAASAPARLALKPDVPPPTNLRAVNGIAIAFTAGYGSTSSAVPELLRHAIRTIVAFLYEHRGEAPAELPLEALALLAPFRVLKL